MSSIPFLLIVRNFKLDVGFCQRGYLGKSPWVTHRQIGKDLPVYFHLGDFQAMDQFTVGKVIKPCRSIDTGNPQRSKVPLLDTAVPEGIVQSAINSLSGTSEQFTSGSAITLRQLQNLVSTLSRFKSSSNSRHFLLLWCYLPDP